MRVFVTGATGFVGEGVLWKLYRADHKIVTLTRRPKSGRVGRDVAQFGMMVHPGDVTDPDSLRGGMDGCDAVIHLTGIIREFGPSTFENIHIRGTQNVVAAARASGVRRFLHISALGTRPNAASRYHQTKWAAEEIVRNSGLDHTIFRPSVIYGPGDAFVNLFARISRFSPVVPVIGGGHAKLQPVPVADVGQCFLNALKEPEAIGRSFDLCGKEVLSLNGIIDAILSVTGRRRLKLPVPMFVARWQALLFESIFPRVFGQPPPLTRDQLLMLREDNVGDAEPANQLFGLHPVSFREGIAEFLKT